MSQAMKSLTIDIENVDATNRVGRRLGLALRASHVVALVGPLGSGKTTLVKAIADGAGVSDLRQVTSPTFVIVNEYDAGAGRPRLRLYHVDAYRLRGSGDLEALGFDEMYSRGAVVIEWADRVGGVLPADLLTVRLESVDDHRRRFHCTANGPIAQQLLAALTAKSDCLP